MTIGMKRLRNLHRKANKGAEKAVSFKTWIKSEGQALAEAFLEADEEATFTNKASKLLGVG